MGQLISNKVFYINYQQIHDSTVVPHMHHTSGPGMQASNADAGGHHEVKCKQPHMQTQLV